MSAKTVSIIGATGMTGTCLTELLLQDKYFETIRLIVRRPLPKTDPRVEIKLVSFSDAESLKLALDGSDIVFCCIGTTQKKVKGDKKLYREIDYQIPVQAAGFCKETGCNRFLIITSVGANSKSGNFYLKLKGEVEDAIAAIGIHSVHIFQPALLLGERSERRRGEKIMQNITRVISVLFFGPLKKYRSIQDKTLAAAMLNASKKEEKGLFRYTYDSINELAGH